jgi:hypothetical protein
MIANGLVKRWENGAGASGFLLYSEQLARLAKKLQAGGRHSLPELQHIFNEWNAHLEMLTCDELAYDSYDIDDYEHYRRRAGGPSSWRIFSRRILSAWKRTATFGCRRKI